MEDIVALAEVRAMVANGTARAVREANGLTLREMARAGQVSMSALWRWENQQRMPRGDAAMRYHAALTRLLER